MHRHPNSEWFLFKLSNRPTGLFLAPMSVSIKGLVIRTTGSGVNILLTNGAKVEGFVAGRFRKSGQRTTNPVAVGDRVDCEAGSDGIYIITGIDERHNYLIRKSVNLSHRAQIIAANIDLLFVVVTLRDPITSTGFIDRILITAEAYHIPAALIFNKSDSDQPETKTQRDSLKELYTKIGYPCWVTSAKTGFGMGALQKAMTDKTCIITGHSGSGKSSLINALAPGLSLRTGELSAAHKQGKHTTTFAELHPLPFGGFIVDTPGIRGFGIVDIDKNLLSHYFPEMRTLLPQCRFNNCLHINEPGCAIKNGVRTGSISPGRYRNYLSIFNDEDEDEAFRTKGY